MHKGVSWVIGMDKLYQLFPNSPILKMTSPPTLYRRHSSTLPSTSLAVVKPALTASLTVNALVSTGMSRSSLYTNHGIVSSSR